MKDSMIAILDMVASERGRQEFLKSQGKFAYTCADKEMTHAECSTVLAEEAGEVAHEVNEGIGPDRYIDKRRLLKELIETAAVAVGWAEKTHAEIESDTTRAFGVVRHNPQGDVLHGAGSTVTSMINNHPEIIPPKYKIGDSILVRGFRTKVSSVSPNHGGKNNHRYYFHGAEGPYEGAYEDEIML